jgi:outer membrane protein assembly factor BamB
MSVLALVASLPRRAAAFALGISSLFAAPDDWPAWRGPHGDNVSRETAWSAHAAAAPLWRAEIGRGYSAPVIARQLLVIDGYFPSESDDDEGEDRVQCLDAASGAVRWTQRYPALAYANEHRGGTLSTATIADEVVYVLARDGVLRSFALADGALRWSVDLRERHGVDPGRYGFASSPYLDGELVIVNASRTVALERVSGATRWISEPLDANYATVAPIQLGAQRGFVVFGGRGIAVLDAASGATLRNTVFRKTPKNVEGATPIVLGTKVFVSSAYDQGAALYDFAADPPRELWRSRAMRTKLAGCTLHEGHLYGFDESMLKCLDLDGTERWRVRGLGQGALSIAGGRLLVTTSEGELVLARATPEGFVEDSRRALFDDGVFWTAPVLANGLLYVRASHGGLVCLDQRLAATAADTAAPKNATELAATDQSIALPTPAELLERYHAAAGFEDEALPALTWRGKLHIVGLGVEDSAALWALDTRGRWHARFDLPPGIGGAIDRVFDGERAWEKNPYRGNKLIEGDELAELLRTRGYRELFDPLPRGLSATTRGIERFRGARCHAVELELEREPRVTRTLYFDAETGLLAGRSALREATVSFADWRIVERTGRKLRLPFARTVFDPDTGIEQRWSFETLRFEAPEEAVFVMPEGLRGEKR